MQKLLSKFRKCVNDFKLIENNDRICVGVSGGKDSMTLARLLKAYQRFSPEKFELVAITLDTGGECDFSNVQKFFSDIDIEYHIVKTNINEVVFNIRKEKNPCSLCSKLRHGALNDYAKQFNCNKVALGHNKDDSIETLLMSMFYEGRIHCFSPKTYLSKKDITLIRPMLYLNEMEIKNFVERNNFPIVKNPCSANGFTKRQYIKDVISSLEEDIPGLQNRLANCLINEKQLKIWHIENDDKII